MQSVRQYDSHACTLHPPTVRLTVYVMVVSMSGCKLVRIYRHLTLHHGLAVTAICRHSIHRCQIAVDLL